MKTVKTQNKQNLFDISIQELGGVEKVFDLAFNNGVSVTTDLEVNTELELNSSTIINNAIVSFYKQRNIKPATASTEAQNELLNQNCGIGCMIIGLTFIVGQDTPETIEEIRLLNQAS